MKGNLLLVRDGQVKLTLPGPSVSIHSDGTIFYGNNDKPIMDGETAAAHGWTKDILAKKIKARKFNEIPGYCYAHLGDNPNGLWVGWSSEWEKHPLKAEVDKNEKEAEIARIEKERKLVKIYLSSRGWGDYSGCEWVGDITQPIETILAECKNLLETGHDVDRRNVPDAEIIEEIEKAKINYNAPQKSVEKESEPGPGYCYSCETYCYGDCGHYAPKPTSNTMKKKFDEIANEANFGIND